MIITATIQDAELLALLKRIEQQFSPAGRASIYAAWADEIKDVFQIPYPPQSNAPLEKRFSWGGELHKFKSLHQQRGFFAALASGEAKVPYQRSLETVRSIRFELKVTAEGASVDVEIPVFQQRGRTVDPKWWLGEENEQSYYFRRSSFWRPLRVILEEQLERFEVLGVTVLENILERIGG